MLLNERVSVLSGEHHSSIRQAIESIIYARKSRQWKYEKEWRLIVETSDEIGNIQLIHDALKIKSITFGIRTPDHHKNAIYELIHKLCDTKIQFYQAEKKAGSLSISIVDFSGEKHIQPFMSPIKT